MTRQEFIDALSERVGFVEDYFEAFDEHCWGDENATYPLEDYARDYGIDLGRYRRFDARYLFYSRCLEVAREHPTLDPRGIWRLAKARERRWKRVQERLARFQARARERARQGRS